MPDLVELLEPATQRTFTEALHADTQLARYAEILDPETLAGLAIVGAHPADSQDLAAAMTPVAARKQLDAYRLLEREDTGQRIIFRLTDTGRRLAAVLAKTVAPPSNEQLGQAKDRLQSLIEEGNAELEPGH